MSKAENSIGIFVGDGESHELSQMAKIRRHDGFVVSGDVMDENIQEALKTVHNRTVVIEGSKLNACVKRAVKDSIDNGASQVIIDLKQTRIDETDEGDYAYTLEERAHNFSIITAWSGFKSNKDKIKVIPDDIWQKELSKGL